MESFQHNEVKLAVAATRGERPSPPAMCARFRVRRRGPET